MSRTYGRIAGTFWTSPTIATLSDDGKLAALYVLSTVHGSIIGAFRLPIGYATEDLGWPADRVAAALAELGAAGFVVRCDKTAWTWVCQHLKWNPLANPNQVTAARRFAQSIPPDCGWRSLFFDTCADVLGLPNDDAKPMNELDVPTVAQTVAPTVPEAVLPTVSSTVPESVAVAVAVAEPENPSGSVDSAAPSRPAPQQPTVPCPYGLIVDAYHRELPTLPKVRLRDGPTWVTRQRAMRSLWGWILGSRKSDGTARAETAEQALQWIAGYFARARDNDFVMGRRKPGPGHDAWRADFDYLVSPKGLKQVIEKTAEAAA